MATTCPTERELFIRRRLSSVMVVLLIVLGSIQTWYLLKVSRARQAQVQRTETLVDSSPVAMILCGEKGTVALYNPAAEEMFGYKASELKGKTVDVLLTSPYRERHADAFAQAARALRENPGAWRSSTRVPGTARHKDGHEFPVLVSLRGIKYDDQVEFIAVIQPAKPEPPKIEPLPDAMSPLRSKL
jgi:PAS domain S-box-containing protein